MSSVKILSSLPFIHVRNFGRLNVNQRWSVESQKVSSLDTSTLGGNKTKLKDALRNDTDYRFALDEVPPALEVCRN